MLHNLIINENILDYIDSLESDNPEYLRSMEREAVAIDIPVIRKQTQSLLKFFIKLKKPSKILEIGTAVGFSASYMSEYMPALCTLTTIEKMPERIIMAEDNFSRLKRKEDIIFIKGDAQYILEELAQKNDKFDFIFLDAAKAQYMNYLEYILKILSEEGLLVTDNVLQEGSIAQSKFIIPRRDRTIHTRMREFLSTIKHMDELETVIIPSGDGLAISFKINVKGAEL